MADHDAVTLYRSATGQPINKIVRRLPDGSFEKGMVPHKQDYVARTVQVGTVEAMGDLLREIGDQEDCALSSSLFVNPPTSEWLTVAKKRLAAHLGLDPDKERQKLAGWHHSGSGPVCARLKENMGLGCWLPFDRDLDDNMPAAAAAWSFEEWCIAVGQVFPGFEKCGKVLVPSTTGRVLVDGTRVYEPKSCHVYVLVTDPDDIPRAWAAAFQRTAITACAPCEWDDGEETPLAFGRPRHARVTGDVIGLQHWTIYDRCTAHINRLFYDGKPVVEGTGLIVAPSEVMVVPGGRLDLSRVPDITAKERKAIDEAVKHLIGYVVRPDFKYGKTRSGRTVVSGVDYRIDDLDMQLELSTDNGPMTITAITNRGVKTRCQTPYRDSSSMAAFVNFFRDGTPYLYDCGTCEMHTLQADRLDYVWSIIKGWLQHRYKPQFKCRDGSIFSETYGRVREGSIKPNPEIIKRLVFACDVPRTKEEGRVIRDQLPVCFKKWLSVAWGAVQDELEMEGDEGVATVESAEELEVCIANLLFTQVSINAGTGDARNAIGSWAKYFATLDKGGWRPVRTYPIWGHVADDGAFRIAFLPTLASTLKVSPEIGVMTPSKLTRMCKSHGFSTGENVIKIDGVTYRRTILTAGFVTSLDLLPVVIDPFTENLEHFKSVVSDLDLPPKGGGGYFGGNGGKSH